MSDLFSDAARAERRYDVLMAFLTAIYESLNGIPQSKVIELKKVAVAAGLTHDLAPDGVDGLMARLKNDDEQTWLWLLDEASGTRHYEPLLETSPFRNAFLFFGGKVQYGAGVELDVSQLKEFIKRIAKHHGELPYRFAVHMPLPEPGMTRIIKKK